MSSLSANTLKTTHHLLEAVHWSTQ